MAWFEAFRNEYGFASYKDNRSAVTVDLPLVAVTYFCVLISIATLIATLGIRGRQRWSSAIRACYAVAIGSIILACLVSHGWQVGDVEITSRYVYRSSMPFKGSVGINVALHGANVTLQGDYMGALGSGYVHFSESMPWADFGQEHEKYSYFLQRGLPDPVLKVMEFLTVDEGGLRWGRTFHSSGHYAMALLWTAFAFWLVTNVLLFSVICYGAYMFFLTGVTMILACVAYHSCQNPEPLVVGFGNADLKMTYGWSFWLTLVSGIITSILGMILIVLDHTAHDHVSEFFHLEKLDDDELDIEDKKGSLSNLMDRRGSIVPPPSERRGSIFLEPSRQPGWYKENTMSKVFFTPGKLNHYESKSFGSDSNISKLNPLYCESNKEASPRANYAEDDVRIDMERVCQESGVCKSTKKPSLATLKEHRENHANERISSSTSKGQGSGHSTNVAFSDEIRSEGNNSEMDKVVGLVDSEDESNGGRYKRCRHPSDTSFGFPSPAGEGNGQRVTVQAETYSRQSSNDSSPSTGVTSVNSDTVHVDLSPVENDSLGNNGTAVTISEPGSAKTILKNVSVRSNSR